MLTPKANPFTISNETGIDQGPEEMNKEDALALLRQALTVSNSLPAQNAAQSPRSAGPEIANCASGKPANHFRLVEPDAKVVEGKWRPGQRV
jgi:hypothetical protein